MIKISDTPGVGPVSRVTPALPLISVADTIPDIDFRATQFAKGQEYFAHILSRTNGRNFNVNVDGTILKMDLGKLPASVEPEVGRTLLLRYLDDKPTPTFSLIRQLPSENESVIELSNAAKMIAANLQQAEQKGTSKFEAAEVITRHPANPQQLTHDLKQAISNTGLFYESHLAKFIEGQRPLAGIMQEPQNQPGNNAGTQLLPQQLSVLETQRLDWQGQVWPGQQMNWTIQVPPMAPPLQPIWQNAAEGGNSEAAQQQDVPIISQLALDLPMLGRVTAKLTLLNGRMRVQLQAEEPQSVQLMRASANRLFTAIESNGQPVEALTVTAHE